MKTERFIIEGMSCAACSSGIERAVGRKEFVCSIEVNLLSKTAKITYDETQGSLEDVFAHIAKMGYAASLLPENRWNGENRENPQDLQTRFTNSPQAKKGFLPFLFLPFSSSFLTPKIKVIFSIVFTLGVLYLSMFAMFFPHLVPEILQDPKTNGVLQLLFTLVVMHMGRDFYFRGIGTLIGRHPNMDTLITIGTGSAFIYSLYLLIKLFIGVDGVSTRHYDGFYFESVCVIIVFVLLGKMIEERSKIRSNDAIKRLVSCVSQTALKIQATKGNGAKGDEVLEIPSDTIVAGDIIKVLPGSHIPVDGIITQGEANIDESMLTGEALPVWKRLGQAVYSGTINTDRAFLMRALKSSKDSTLYRIIEMIENAQGSKAPIARIADRVSAIFVPIVMIIATLAGIFWWGQLGDFGFALEIFVSVLVISCPCALGLATPMAIMVGGGRAADGGIFFKNAKSLENTQKVTAVVFDKTGTLSVGAPVLDEIVVFDTSKTKEDIIALASGVELGSEHIIAKSIVKYAKEHHIEPEVGKDFEAKSGYGITATIGQKRIKLGNEESFCFENPAVSHQVARITQTDGIVVLVGETGTTEMTTQDTKNQDRLLGAIILKDALKPHTKKTIATIKAMGLKTILLSGDKMSNVQTIADELEVDEAIAHAKPNDKLEKIQSLKNQNEIVMMVGDGMNDAPALALADISLAMGKGSDVSIQASDIVAFNDDIRSVINAISLSRATIKNIKENLFWAFCYNVVSIPLACGVAYGAGILLNPMIASLAMSLSSLSVVFNAQRLRGFRFKE
ncbi:heavy metal translocating P-type ATPase [Helicobacter sp. 11S02596-1]|uniref:heavy metal translocating P-type ATPase n=1 Tax=Helicobacter sp. 11S02596-1 TaxID=1476194 RepID=UPI000BA7C687|nr:heavy metal translocating P-type ATPase [Helicobacter sp. 11S02596-1]PAF44874.1 copper-translocating P-type ATPase [Helicobacter sp. 11S02596-1]